jgi:hypothetical protein
MNKLLKYIVERIGILAAVFFLSILPCCKNRNPDKKAGYILGNHDIGLFLVRVISVMDGSEKDFVDHLKKMYLPVWSDLHKKGRLHETSVFQIHTPDSLQTEDPPGNFLILIHLSPETLPKQLLEAEMESINIQSPHKTFFPVIRSELMVPTPNSYYPVLNSRNYERVEEVEFFVEFIDVNNSPEDLDLYRQLMSSYFGPSNGILIQKNLVFSFTAFETREIISNTDNEASWNQIHIGGDYPEYLDLNWDSLYSDLFRTEFQEVDLDSIWDLLPPIRELPPYYSGHFIKELHLQ